MSGAEALDAHLAEGATGVARCWKLIRRDGVCFGFTDHDEALAFDGVTFKAESGLTAAALSQTTGLSVDNTEAVGALSDAAITEADIEAGRFDGAWVEAWLVKWDAPEARVLQFRGSIGELVRQNGAFSAELRGLAEAMNQPQGRVYQKSCTAILGDGVCGFDLDTAGYSTERPVEVIEEARVFLFEGLDTFEPRWFEKGRVRVLSGAAEGLVGMVKNDRFSEGVRRVELWEPLRAAIVAGDMVRLEAGCDKRMETCRLKFDNLLNFRGFPDIPGEDWLISVPARTTTRNGQSRR
ncbi:DUF2163 domain-containing protein [Rhodophyticola sp. CCM32]|uniref:DUF2163 domain-containing protein n=1 Tax=Rhodophyticola sp. CCM32 TaxID=2916397 RepID=UPI00107EEA72|nr:DUF2163 domain-containing protein [Rhodophyticola sp. CCM32]QBX99848.1 DUF2163 domain-containing protein [Rhodophyticola sp. CCM32]